MTLLDPAPLFTDIAPGPDGGAAYWIKATDGVRLRVAAWRDGSAQGTVLLFPGRTEYVEKYGPAAAEFAKRGYATLAVDWRGQGLADRLIPDGGVGHVYKFADYLRDVDAVMAAAAELDMPRPWHLLGHSMGGGIGLFALMDGLRVETAAFTGPMWGIRISGAIRPVAWTMANVAPLIGLGQRLPPSTRRENYVLAQPFDDNTLTRDAEMYQMMRAQITAHPELAIGGPTLTWLREALSATRSMAARPAPPVPCLCILGGAERIVDTDRIHARMDNWPDGELLIVPDAEHEVMMEVPEIRQLVFDRIAARFATPGKTKSG